MTATKKTQSLVCLFFLFFFRIFVNFLIYNTKKVTSYGLMSGFFWSIYFALSSSVYVIMVLTKFSFLNILFHCVQNCFHRVTVCTNLLNKYSMRLTHRLQNLPYSCGFLMRICLIHYDVCCSLNEVSWI